MTCFHWQFLFARFPPCFFFPRSHLSLELVRSCVAGCVTPELWPYWTLSGRAVGNTSLQAWHSLGAQGGGYHVLQRLSSIPTPFPAAHHLASSCTESDGSQMLFSSVLLRLLLPSKSPDITQKAAAPGHTIDWLLFIALAQSVQPLPYLPGRVDYSSSCAYPSLILS